MTAPDDLERLIEHHKERAAAEHKWAKAQGDPANRPVFEARATFHRSAAATLTALVEERERMRGAKPTTGDLWWIAGDGESGFGDASDAYEAATDWKEANNEPIQLSRALSLPDVWAVNVTLTRDDNGDPDETEVQLFATEAEALAALSQPQEPA